MLHLFAFDNTTDMAWLISGYAIYICSKWK